ncbi:MAG: nicotinate phosphoribosyltransferase, partial [Deltaproteobacteria bacterium]|nr:nicotinate phosphoribosyltransferase [Deltaproteobacteria bacterium]
RMSHDTIALRDEELPQGRPLLEKVMDQGRVVKDLPDLKTCREYFAAQFALLPAQYKALEGPPAYPVHLSPGLERLQHQVEQELRERELGES